MNFFEWYGIGIAILFVIFAKQSYESNSTIKDAAFEMYHIFIRKADVLSSGILLLAALLGPLLVPIIAYFEFRAWRDNLAIDDEDNRDYPWSKE